MRRTLSAFVRAVPEYLAYEAVTRLLMAAVVLPLVAVATTLLVSTRGAVTNATFLPFLASWQGVLFVLLVLALLMWLVVVELGGAIVISARRRVGLPPASYPAIVRHNVGRAANLLTGGGALVLLYVAVILPLGGTGFTLSLLDRVAVPRFVMAVIEASPAFLAGCLALTLLLAVLALALSYTFPLILVGDLTAWAAIRTSVVLAVRRPGVLLRRYVGPLVVGSLLVAAVAAVWFVGVALLFELAADEPWAGPLLVVLLGLQQVAVLLSTMLVLPWQAHLIMDAYHAALPAEGPLAALSARVPEVRPRHPGSPIGRLLARPRRLGVLLGSLVLVVLVAAAVPVHAVVGELATLQARTGVIAHRAGGDGARENSLTGLEYAVSQGADGVEVDVQRTRDGHYVLNHDDTFARVAGDPRPASALTLAEVRALRLAGTDERVPTLEEFLTAARGRVPVLLELKGATADQRMGDDVVALLDRLGMRDEAVLMSLNYPLVQYLEGRYPDYATGFAYFWSVGDVSLLTADVIMLEEGEASADRLLALTAAGKRAYVWTVNDPETMATLAQRGASALITDDVPTARRVTDRSAHPTAIDVLRRLFGLEAFNPDDLPG